MSFDGGHPFLNPDIVRPVGPTDPAVGVVLLREAGTNRPRGVLVNFAMHVCTVGSGISGDYPYFLDEALRATWVRISSPSSWAAAAAT